MLTKKHVFKSDTFKLECGRTIPIQVGYETFGTLNDAQDNAVLIPHYFMASSHCAGKYRESDTLPGYWDDMIGPGKAVDTNKYFVISSDNLCNCNAYDPFVYTSGPASINPDTGKPYAMDFPLPTIGDMVNSEKALLDSLGIQHVRVVMGASMGGMIAYEWAVRYPDFIDKIIPIIACPRHPSMGSVLVLQPAIRIAMLDPKWNKGNYYGQKEQPEESLSLAMQLMFTAASAAGACERSYRRNSLDVECYKKVAAFSSAEKTLYDFVKANSGATDLNHWIYSCKICMNADISRPYGGDMDAALSRITAKVLAIPCKHDVLHPWELVDWTVERIKWLGGSAELYPIDSDTGHMAGIALPHLFDDKVRDFLNH
jgi:homoserine O-acetyltransferase